MEYILPINIQITNKTECYVVHSTNKHTNKTESDRIHFANKHTNRTECYKCILPIYIQITQNVIKNNSVNKCTYNTQID